MTSILCLAHYCDLHGPTPLMVTEGTPVPCSACAADVPTLSKAPQPRTPTSAEAAQAAGLTEALRRINLDAPQRSASAPVSEQEAQAHRASLRASAQSTAPTTSSSAVETPPQSPRPSHGAGGAQPQKPRLDSGFRRTYDDYVTRRAGPCENCALTLPKRQESSRDAAVGSRPDRGPTLRTRAPCARVFTGLDSTASPPTSQSSSSVTSEDESSGRPRPPHRRVGTTFSTTSRSSASSGSANPNAHMHYLDYTSTHEPLAPASFSLVRASCLRTLSLETLPRAPATTGAPPAGAAAMPTPSGSPNNSSPAYVTTHSAGAAASGGSIFFGDKKVGYTTAYIFRVPDVHARGHKRVYAFLALSTHPEPIAVKTFTFLSAAFRDLAAWIQELAEAEAERALADSAGSGSSASSPVVPGPGYGSFPAEAAAVVPPPPPVTGGGSGGSSFLMGGMGGLSRRMGGGFAGAGVALKQRGLAELVGLPDFFIELHAKFVRLLLEIGVVVGA
ncbi:vesicle coat protein [Staphylotrichum tortipilum]|uniref:Vesicle coat protein n=1 Tax=Staphylotrichum tortipilum TaxID=2831512 RepID=A0AAN6RSP2_9PEZI|nr:vesicle coat protein [Staphylotrichum longicolle]